MKDYRELARLMELMLSRRPTSEQLIDEAIEHLRHTGFLLPWSAAGEVAFRSRCA